MTEFRDPRNPFAKTMMAAATFTLPPHLFVPVSIVPPIPHPSTVPDNGPKYSYDLVPPHQHLTWIAVMASMLVNKMQGTPFPRTFVMSWPEYERFVDYRWLSQSGYFPTLQRVGYTKYDYNPKETGHHVC